MPTESVFCVVCKDRLQGNGPNGDLCGVCHEAEHRLGQCSCCEERRVRDEITAAGDDIDEEQIAEWFRAVFGRAPGKEDSDPYSLTCAAVGACE